MSLVPSSLLKQKQVNWAMRFLTQEVMLVVLIVLCIFLALTKPVFYSSTNLLNILRSVSIYGIIALGMTMVIIAGEIDLSVGSMVALSGCVATLSLVRLSEWGWPPLAAGFVGVLLALATGGLGGGLIAVLRNRWKVPSFITSLALLTVIHGTALRITGGVPITNLPKWLVFLGSGSVWGLPVPAIVLLSTFIVVAFLMGQTVFGRMVYAVGGNAEAARLSGVPVGAIRMAVLVMTGILAAVAGLIQAGKINSGRPDVGEGVELEAIAAVIIGGTALSGGSGRVWGTLVGLLFTGVIVNGMTLMNFETDWQYVIRGGLILLAVMTNQLIRPGNSAT